MNTLQKRIRAIEKELQLIKEQMDWRIERTDGNSAAYARMCDAQGEIDEARATLCKVRRDLLL